MPRIARISLSYSVSPRMRLVKESFPAEEGLILPVIGTDMKTAFQSLVEHWCGTEQLSYALCDFSVMVSPAMFEEFILPELEATAGAFDHTTYHLDGLERLARHLAREEA